MSHSVSRSVVPPGTATSVRPKRLTSASLRTTLSCTGNLGHSTKRIVHALGDVPEALAGGTNAVRHVPHDADTPLNMALSLYSHVGIAAISVYDIDEAVNELERCAKAGIKGSIIWQAPHPDLPFHSEHYNKFWAASQDLEIPVHLHILTGHGYHKESVFGNKRTGVEAYRGSVNLKLK